MGMTDGYLVPKMPQHIVKQINNLSSGSRVAWLGQIHPDMNNTSDMYKAIMSLVEVEDLKCDFYDLNNDDSIAENAYVWDVNTEWDFTGYDIIVAVRIFYACNSASQLVRNIKKMVSTGQNIVGDLMSGNTGTHVSNPESGVYRQYYSTMVEDCEVFTKPANSKAIIPMLPRTWIDYDIKNPVGAFAFGVKQNHDDQVLTEEMFSENGIKMTPISVFREPTKYRIYSICEFTNDV